MGSISARKAREIVKNSRRIVATEIMAACQAIEFREKEFKLGIGTEIAYNTFRESVKSIDHDSEIEIYDELEKAT